MKVENLDIQNAVKELIIDHPIEEVSVVFVCKHLNIKRQTFYYHYQNIYDVLDSVFIDDAFKFVSENLSDLTFKKRFEKYLNDNFNFIKVIAKSNVNELWKEFVFDVFYNHLLSKYSNERKNPELKARFAAGGASFLLSYYFEGTKADKLDDEYQKIANTIFGK